MYTVEDIRKEFNRLDRVCGIDTSGIEIVFSDRYVMKNGTCYLRNGMPYKITIASFLKNESDAFWDTVKHEYAHALVAIRNPKEKHGHDYVWRKACIEVGCDPERMAKPTASQKKKKQQMAKYEVKCTSCGASTLYLRRSKVVKTVQLGKKVYICSKCKSSELVCYGIAS